jgi:hypothetical protein
MLPEAGKLLSELVVLRPWQKRAMSDDASSPRLIISLPEDRHASSRSRRSVG